MTTAASDTQKWTADRFLEHAHQQSEIGVPGWGWPPLAPDTLARKGGINTPLLETGELQESIRWNSDHSEGYVGSDDSKAAFHEFGNSRMPPRPFLATALAMKD
jgi:phage gpG-like protein